MEQHEIFQLSNGIRCVYHPTKNIAGHFGVTIKAGTRYEQEAEEGIAHFIEHCIFKGTERRKAFHILNRLDSVGGELNAFTGKEEICIYSSFLKKHLSRSAELISDIIFNATFPEKEIAKEKEVVLDEIMFYRDMPGEQIFDDFESYLFEDHPLGKSVLGTERQLRAFTKADVAHFWQKALHAENIIISIVGDYKINQLKKTLEKFFSDRALNGIKNENHQKIDNCVFEKKIQKNQNQVHTIIGNKTESVDLKTRRQSVLLNNILGGPTLNARLMLNIREKYGYAYNIESMYIPYSDAGSFQIYYSTDQKYTDKINRLIHKELKKLKEKKLGTMQLHQAKEQLKGQLALARENQSNLMLSAGKSLMDFGVIYTPEQIYSSIDEIKADEIRDTANTLLGERNLSYLSFTPNKEN